MWFGAMYWNPAIPPIAAVSIEILKFKIMPIDKNNGPDICYKKLFLNLSLKMHLLGKKLNMKENLLIV